MPSIDSPTTGDSVSSSEFYVTGTWGAGPLYCYMQNGGPPAMGVLINMPPNYVFQFQNVPSGASYVLTVQDFVGNSQVVTNLIVVSG
jgi:hypothetical protein